MPPPPPFQILQRYCDNIVDAEWAEPVQMVPWTNSGYSAEGGPDPSRTALTSQGCYVTAGSNVRGEGMAGLAGAQLPIFEQEVWLSIQSELMGPSTDWKAYDRVFFPDRAEWYQINKVDPSATFRNNVHLTRLNDQEVQGVLQFQAQGKLTLPRISKLQARRMGKAVTLRTPVG